MNKTISWLTLVLAITALVVAIIKPSGTTGEKISAPETAFERVMRTRTIRCAYSPWPPYFMADPNTREMSGINHDIILEIARITDLKIEWNGEVGYGAFPNNLRAGKQDVFCSGVRLSAARAQRVELSTAVAYSPLYPFVRDGDNRFDGNMDLINSSNVTIAVMDGSTIEAIAKSTFPQAKLSSLPEMAEAAQAFDDVVLKKADVVFAEISYAADYNAHNPVRKLRRVADVPPLRVLPPVFAVGKGEWELRDLLNAAIAELMSDGTIDRIVSKYSQDPSAILQVTKPYVLPAK